jgi:HEPN domain
MSDESDKLAKAEQFLEVADFAASSGYFDVAVSLAVSAGINGADVVCFLGLGQFPTGASHTNVLSLLRKYGTSGDAAASQLRALLSVKEKAQYRARRCSETEARRSVRSAERIVGRARDMMRGRA